MELVAKGAPAQEIGGASLDLSGAGAAKSEVHVTVLHEPVHFVEQRRDFLDLVNDDLCVGRERLRFQLLAKKLGSGDVASVLVRLQQVQPSAFAVQAPQEGALAGLAWPPEKEGLRPGAGQDQGSLEHELQINMII